MLDSEDYQAIWKKIPETTQLTIRHLQNRRKHAGIKIGMSVKCLNRNLIRDYKSLWTELNEELQDLWGFKHDPEMYKFWEIPGCTCPTVDNEERYGCSVGQIINSDCPIHGTEQLKWEVEHEVK